MRASCLGAWALGLAVFTDCGLAQDVATPGPSRNSHSQAALEGAKSSRLSLSDAIDRAEKSSSGRAVEAVFTPFATGGGSHDVTILRPDGMLALYHIDANEGSFVGVTDKALASLTTSLTPQAVAGARTSLLQAIASVEGRAPNQRAIGAAVKQDDETITYEITVATTDGDRSFHVDAAGGVSE